MFMSVHCWDSHGRVDVLDGRVLSSSCRHERLQRLAEKVHKDCRSSEDHLEDIEQRLIEVSVTKYSRCHLGCISFLLPRLRKLPSLWYSNEPGNLDSLGSKKEI